MSAVRMPAHMLSTTCTHCGLAETKRGCQCCHGNWEIFTCHAKNLQTCTHTDTHTHPHHTTLHHTTPHTPLHTHFLQVGASLSNKVAVVLLQHFNLKTIVVVHLAGEGGGGAEGGGEGWGRRGREEGAAH